MESKKSCTFFGHREIVVTDKLINQITKIIKDKIENEQFKDFYFGGFGNFDDLCYKIVSKLKEEYNHIRRIFCLYDRKHINISKRPEWLKNEEYEDIIFLEPSFDGWYKRIYFRNLEMVDLSDFILFYVCNTENSGAYKTFKYAKKKKKIYINLAEEN